MASTVTLPDVLTIQEVADFLRLPEDDVRRYAARLIIPGRQIGDQWRFSRRALEEWLRGPSAKQALLSQAGAFEDDKEDLEALRTRSITTGAGLRSRKCRNVHLLDTDTLSHLWARHERVVQRAAEVGDTELGVASITKAEILRRRCENLLKAGTAQETLKAQQRLDRSEQRLSWLIRAVGGICRQATCATLEGGPAETDWPRRSSDCQHHVGKRCYPGDAQPEALPPGAEPQGRQLGGLTLRPPPTTEH